MLGLEYRIKDLESGGKDISLPLSREHLVDALADLGDLDVGNFTGAVQCDAHLQLQGTVVQCEGWLRGNLLLPCQRCLEAASVAINVRLQAVYTLAAEKDETAPTDDDDLGYGHHDGEIVNLWPLMREELILAVPITVVCKEDCQGLCPMCGVDRNSSSCACQPAARLSTFAGLVNVKLPT